ncbi:hypothetical protein U9R62_08830 [Cylindrospermopsis raciborskii DSH]|uniref:hypothetical protein n=1 Tax=Cylindrospermopsis raciborskii TaxID=77022 RepID=UPI002ED7A570
MGTSTTICARTTLGGTSFASTQTQEHGGIHQKRFPDVKEVIVDGTEQPSPKSQNRERQKSITLARKSGIVTYRLQSAQGETSDYFRTKKQVKCRQTATP